MAFKYSAVKGGEFRLLTIHPRNSPVSNAVHDNSQPALVSTSLSKCSLEMPPEYYALSYTWGEATDKISILVDGYEHQVTRNLGLALKHIQREYDPVVLWADALCIDQSNDSERKEQVSQMTEIYRSAKLTIVWLGVPELGASFVQQFDKIGVDLLRLKIRDGDVDRTFEELMTEIALVSMVDEESLERYDNLKKMKNDWEDLNQMFAASLKDIPVAMALIVGYDSLMNQSYWSRVWIQQEFVVSTEVVIRWGDSEVTLSRYRANFSYYNLLRVNLANELIDQITKLSEGISEATNGKLLEWFGKGCPSGFMEDDDNTQLTNLKTAFKYYSHFTSAITPNNFIFGARYKWQKHQNEMLENEGMRNNSTLIQLLTSVFVDKTVHATDPKDRIFAMFGMATDRVELESLGLKVQYKNITDVAIYINAARAMIANGHVDLLSLSQHRHSLGKRSSIYVPSWVPDWRSPIARPGGQVPWQSFFNTSGDKTFKRPEENKMASNNKINLYGWRVDTIEEMKPSWVEPDALYSENLVNNLQYLIDINDLFTVSGEKIGKSGKDIYLKDSRDLETSVFRIPIADQELLDTGFIRRANDETRVVHISMAKIRLQMTPEQIIYVEQMKVHRSRRPFISRLGYIGLVPDHAKNGDILVIFRGGKFPYVLRRSFGGTYNLVGEAYVHGIMYGQYFQVPGKKKEVIFTLR